jgi:hypothetical protein
MKKKPHRLLIGVVDFTTRIKGCIATCPISGTKHGSWLDMAESELAVLTTQCLSRRIPNKQTLEREVAAWQHHRNKHHAKADWQFTADDARVKLKRLYPSL